MVRMKCVGDDVRLVLTFSRFTRARWTWRVALTCARLPRWCPAHPEPKWRSVSPEVTLTVCWPSCCRTICPVQALGCNAPLIWFLISALYILFACLCFPACPFSSLFLTCFLSCSSLPLRIDPLLFQAGCRKRQLNVALVFCQSEWQRTGINGESTSLVWPTLGSRTAKEQNSFFVYFGECMLLSC